MQNQPPTRLPWLRLASQARMESPVAPPVQPAQPPPRPVRLPSFPFAATTAPAAAPPPATAPTPAPVPSPPPPSAATQPSPPVQPSPSPPPRRTQTPPQKGPTLPPPQEARPRSQETPTSPAMMAAAQPPAPSLPRIRMMRSRTPTPPQSPKVIKASLPTTPPPSPSPRVVKELQTSTPAVQPMPVPEPEPEPKRLAATQPKTSVATVHEDQTNISPNNSKTGNHSATTASWNKKPLATRDDNETGRWRAITIAGENIGAYMELGSPLHRYSKNQHGQIQLQHQVTSGVSKQVHGGSGDAGVENGSSSSEAEKKTAKARPMMVVANSNVQAINNSMVLGSSCVHHSPGIHIALSSHQLPKNNGSSSAGAGS